MLHLRAIVVPGEKADGQLIERVLVDHGDSIEVFSDVNRALARLTEESFDAIFISLSLPRGDGLALVHHVRALHPMTEVIVMSAPTQIEETAHASALGVLHTIVLPLTGDAVLLAADRARERKLLVRERERLVADEAKSRRRSASYARSAAFISEIDLRSLARGLLDAALGEIDAKAGSIYLPISGERFERIFARGAAEEHPLRLDEEDLAEIDPTTPVRREGDRVSVDLLGDFDLLGHIRLDLKGALPVSAAEALENLAGLGVAALTAARKADAIARAGIKDPETSAYTFAYFGDIAGREIDRAKRYQRNFALLTVGFDGLDELKKTLSYEEIARLRRATADGILEGIRGGDILARVEEDEYYILLPETDLLGANVVRRRVRIACGEVLEAEGVPRHLAAPILGVAAYPGDGADLGRLLSAVRRRSDQAGATARKRAGLRERDLWGLLEQLVDDEDGTDGEDGVHRAGELRDTELAFSARTTLAEASVARMGVEVASTIAHQCHAGTVYLGGAGSIPEAIARALPSPSVGGIRIGKLGAFDGPGFDLEVRDPRLEEMGFFLSLTDLGGYALIYRRAPHGLTFFHSSELDLVDALFVALQREYHLQPESEA